MLSVLLPSSARGARSPRHTLNSPDFWELASSKVSRSSRRARHLSRGPTWLLYQRLRAGFSSRLLFEPLLSHHLGEFQPHKVLQGLHRHNPGVALNLLP